MTLQSLSSSDVDQRLPLFVLVMVSLQHAILVLAFMVYPLAVSRGLGFSEGDTQQLITACILSTAVATIIHFFPAPWGTRTLAIEVPTPVYVTTSMIVGSVGGLSAIAAMSLISGLVSLLFSKFLWVLRFLFPAEVCGVAIIMLGISLVGPGMTNALGLNSSQSTLECLIVSIVTLGIIIAVAVFGNQRIKIFALIAGLVAGLVAAVSTGLFGENDLTSISSMPWIGIPDIHLVLPAMASDAILLVIVMSLISSIDNLGMMVSIQRQTQPQLDRINYGQASAGVRVSSLGDFSAALFGGMPTGISSANISLAHATGTVSRYVSVVTGIFLLVAVFTPRLVTALTLIPRPVVGAVMIYAAAYMLVAGIGLLSTRLLNERRTFTIGLSIVLGMTPLIIHGISAELPKMLKPIIESPLALGCLSAMALTLIFRLGETQRKIIKLTIKDEKNESLQEFYLNRSLRNPLLLLGQNAGISKLLVEHAVDITSEFLASVIGLKLISDELSIEVCMHGQHIDLAISYHGSPLEKGYLKDSTYQQWEIIRSNLAKKVRFIKMESREKTQCILLSYE